MPIVNGDFARDAAPLLSPKPVEEHTTASKVLQNEYANGDGLDVHELLDSAKHGGLTYNDFLVLPGYIGMTRTQSTLAWLTRQRLRGIGCHAGYARHETYYVEDAVCVFAYGHGHRAQYGHSYGAFGWTGRDTPQLLC